MTIRSYSSSIVSIAAGESGAYAHPPSPNGRSDGRDRAALAPPRAPLSSAESDALIHVVYEDCAWRLHAVDDAIIAALAARKAVRAMGGKWRLTGKGHMLRLTAIRSQYGVD